MKKIVGAVVVLALTGGVAYAVVHNPERSACLKMADLCGVKGGTKADLDQCVEEAKTCGEATGCVAGAGVKGMQGAINEFFKGFGKASQ